MSRSSGASFPVAAVVTNGHVPRFASTFLDHRDTLAHDLECLGKPWRCTSPACRPQCAPWRACCQLYLRSQIPSQIGSVIDCRHSSKLCPSLTTATFGLPPGVAVRPPLTTSTVGLPPVAVVSSPLRSYEPFSCAFAEP